MPLSSTKAKAAKQDKKDYKLSDSKGLYLLVTKSGSKYWRMKYRINGKEKVLALGVYPDVSLSEAREGRDAARNLHAKGIDPSQHKQKIKRTKKDMAANSFELVAREWLVKRGPKSDGGDKRLHRLLEKDLYPYIGKSPISEINPTDLLSTLRRIEARGAVDTAHRAKQAAGMVFRYAIASGLAERDPSADLKGALQTPNKTHFKTITNPEDVGVLMRAIDSYQGTPVVMAALKLSPLLFCRPGELRQLEWDEVQLKRKQIELPETKMKMGSDHIVPLSKQAVLVLEELHMHTGRGRYVFPSARGASRPLSENGVRTALRTMGYTNEQITPHGFRAMARTLLDEVLGYRVDWIEHQLAHAVKDSNGRAYNRTAHLEGRREMMQGWADYLEGLKNA